MGYSPNTSLSEVFFEEVVFRIFSLLLAEIVALIVCGVAILVLCFIFDGLRPNIVHSIIVQQIASIVVYYLFFGKD